VSQRVPKAGLAAATLRRLLLRMRALPEVRNSFESSIFSIDDLCDREPRELAKCDQSRTAVRISRFVGSKIAKTQPSAFNQDLPNRLRWVRRKRRAGDRRIPGLGQSAGNHISSPIHASNRAECLYPGVR
jgi:hypothetical protein